MCGQDWNIELKLLKIFQVFLFFIKVDVFFGLFLLQLQSEFMKVSSKIVKMSFDCLKLSFLINDLNILWRLYLVSI